MESIGQGIIVGLGVLGPAIGVAMVFAKGLEGIARNPEAANRITPLMFVGAGLVEVLGLATIALFFLI